MQQIGNFWARSWQSIQNVRFANILNSMYNMVLGSDTPYISGYKMGRIISKGQFGSVFECKSNSNHAMFAAKVIFNHEAQDPRQEINALKSIRGIAGVIQYTADYYCDPNWVVLTDFVPGQCLFDVICIGIHKDQARNYFKQMCQTMRVVHELGIVHRDLKPENMIVSDNKIVIADWGMAFWPATTRERRPCGSPCYAAPELLNEENYSFPIDVWSLGCILYAMLTTSLAYQDSDFGELFYAIKRCIAPDYNQEGLCPESVRLLKGIFVLETNRLTLEQILNDPWLSD